MTSACLFLYLYLLKKLYLWHLALDLYLETRSDKFTM